VKINKEIRDIILKRLLVTLGVLLFIRIGTFLPVPGINHNDLALIYGNIFKVNKPITKISFPENVLTKLLVTE